MEPATTSPSCPRCGADCPAGAARCGGCGFALVDAAERRRLLRLRPTGTRTAALAGVAAASAVAGAVVILAGRDASPAATPPAPVSALEAERRLELRYGGASDDETAAVRCPRRIAPRRITRCELRYRDGIARALLVRLSPRGELEADVPYPATLRR